MSYTKKRLAKVTQETETLATILRSPGAMVTTSELHKLCDLALELCAFGRFAYSLAKVRKLPEGSNRA